MRSSQVRDADLQKVLAAVDQVTANREESLAWLERPLEAFGGQTPTALLASDRVEDVLGYLDSVSSGFVG